MDSVDKMDHLIALIRRLTTSEKTFISKKLRLSNSHKNHRILLQIILKDANGNDDEIKAKFLKVTKSKFYRVVKNQLQTLILGYLVELSRSRNVDTVLLQQIAEAEVLLKKSLNKQATKILKRVLKEAERYELLYLKIYIQDLLVGISLKFEPNNKLTVLHQDLCDSIFEYKNLAEVIKYRMQWNEIYFEIASDTLRSERFEKLENELSLFKTDDLMSLKSKSIFYHTQGVLKMTYRQDFKAAAEVYSMAIENMESHPILLTGLSELYLSALHNLSICYTQLEDEANFFKTLAKIRNVGVKDKYSLVQVLERVSLNLQTFLLKKNRFAEVAEEARKAEKHIFYYANLMQPALCISIFTNCIVSHIMIGNYRYCVKWLNYIINNKFFVEYKIQARVWIYNLLVHYELGHFDYIESVIPGTTRFLAAHSCNNGLNKVMVVFFQKIILEPNDKFNRGMFTKLMSQIETGETEMDNNGREFKYNLNRWVAEKIKHYDKT